MPKCVFRMVVYLVDGGRGTLNFLFFEHHISIGQDARFISRAEKENEVIIVP